MSSLKTKLPEISEAEQTPLVQALLRIILEQQVRIEELEAEIKRLKELKGKPKSKPSRMDAETEKPEGEASGEGRKRGPQRSKTATLKIHGEKVIAPEGLPSDAREKGWRFKGYDDFVVQELKIETCNMRYRLEEWQGPDGQYLKGKLPESVEGHYGAQLKSHVLYPYHHPRVTQPLLLEQLHEWGVEISAGQLNPLLTEKHDAFHDEKAPWLEVGLQVSRHLQTDDTGARHKNGYCTYIGNEFFAWFESTESKSRVNFLSLLRAGHTDYVLLPRYRGMGYRSMGALEYMARPSLPQDKLPQSKLKRLEEGKSFPGKKAWDAYLEAAS